MTTYTAYLATLTVKALNSIARGMGLKGYSRLRKADLVATVARQAGMDEMAAYREITEAAHDEALHIDAHHTDIKVNQGWNCCQDAPYAVGVFANGARWVLCRNDVKSAERGGLKIETLPNGRTAKCMHCDLIVWVAYPVIQPVVFSTSPIAASTPVKASESVSKPRTDTDAQEDTDELIAAYRSMRHTVHNMRATDARIRITGRLRNLSAILKRRGIAVHTL